MAPFELLIFYSVCLQVESLAGNTVINGHGAVRNHTSYIDMAAEATCSDLWFTGYNGTCECGNSVHDVVHCNQHTREVMILDCYCMTTDSETNVTVIGDCLYNCGNTSHRHGDDFLYHRAPSNCSNFHRNGTLCGECEETYFPTAYSYDVDCIQCTHSDSWWLYIAAAFLPMTLFIAIIFFFRINVVSPKLHVFVFFAQVLAAPINVQAILLNSKYSSYYVQIFIRVLATMYGIWNLDFFRTLIPGICLHLSGLQILALDYLIAVYPLLLMVIAYTLVELHGYGFKLVLFLWRPFHYIFARFRRQWNIQTSIVDALATIFILSTTKLLNVSFTFISPIELHLVNGNSLGLFLYYNPNVEFMSIDHLPYALLALSMFAVFFLLPSCLLVFSSLDCIRKRFTIRIRVIKEFLFVFQKYYKDGTNGTRDCRWYAAGCYIFVSFTLHVMYAFTLSGITYLYSCIVYTIAALIVLMVEPYKEEYAVYNVIECLQFLWLALFCISVALLNVSGLLQQVYLAPCVVFLALVSITPLVYIAAVFTQWLFCRSTVYKKCHKVDIETSLPHRITHSCEYRGISNVCGVAS